MYTQARIPFWESFKLIWKDLLIILVGAVGLAYLDNRIPSLPLTVPGLLGTAISLVLAFRINQSYDRWWEARKAWGAIVNDSRSLVRQLLSLQSRQVEHPEALEKLQRKMVYRHMAWCYATGEHLRKQDARAGKEAFLSPEELAYIQQQKNVPNALLLLQGLDLKWGYEQSWYSDDQQRQIDSTFNRLTTSLGICERIKNTVFPRVFNQLIHFSIYAFVFLLLLGIKDEGGYMEVPAVLLVSLVFLLLEKVAIVLQDPFENRPSDTAMSSLARTIEINARQMLGEEELPEPWPAHKYWVM